MNLDTDTFKLFKKENTVPLYIITQSNHPPSVTIRIFLKESIRGLLKFQAMRLFLRQKQKIIKRHLRKVATNIF